MDTHSLIPLLLQAAALGLAAAVSPGVFQAFLLSESLLGGWRRGLPVAFAPLLSDAPIVVMVVFLLDRLPPIFLRLISLAGGAFALYLAWGLWQSWRMDEARPDFDQTRRRNGLLRGMGINLLSPGPYLFWAFINGPILLTALKVSTLHGGVFVLGFYIVFIGTMLAMVGLFHQARRLGQRVLRILLLAGIIALILSGCVLLKWAISPTSADQLRGSLDSTAALLPTLVSQQASQIRIFSIIRGNWGCLCGRPPHKHPQTPLF